MHFGLSKIQYIQNENRNSEIYLLLIYWVPDFIIISGLNTSRWGLMSINQSKRMNVFYNLNKSFLKLIL